MKSRRLKRPLLWFVPALLFPLLLVLAIPGALVTAGARLPAIQHVAGAEDWPTYLHDIQRTAASGETILSTSNAAQLTRLWSFKTGGTVAASPAVVGGVVYVGSWDGYEYALNAATGAMIWKTYLGVTNANAYCNPPSAGISSGAAVQNGVVYVGGGDDYWYALNATTGAILWKVYTGDSSAAGGHYNWSSPLLYNGYAYIGVASMGDCPLVQGQLLQVSLSTHQIVNTLNLVPNGQIGGGIWSSPSIDTATNTIYVTTGTESATAQTWAQALLAIDASSLTVKDSWKLPESVAVFDSDFGTTPTLFTDAAGDQLVGAIDKNGIAYAFKRDNLSAGPVWQQTIAVGGDCPTCGYSSVSSGAFGGGRLYLSGEESAINGTGHLGAVRALDPATGDILWQDGEAGPVMPALAYTNGMVLVGAGATFEVLDASTGERLYSYQTGNILYAAPSVSQGEIFTGGTDGNVYAFGLASPPSPPPSDPNCPNGWSCQDIGTSTPAGSETVSGGSWSVSAGGAGVGGASDQFRLLSQNLSGDTQITAQVATQQATSATSQAGLMIRQTADPGSPYYALFVNPNNKLVVQYRTVFGGAATVANTVSTGGLPLYLEVQRIGDQFQAATSTDGTNYTLVPGTTATVVMPTAILAGLAVSSGVNGTSGTATYSNIVLGAPDNSLVPPSSATPCPNNWNCADVGNPLLVGDQSLNAGTWTIKGGGGSDWYNADQFHYVWQTLPGDGTVSAQVLSQSNTDAWAKAGVMLRQDATGGSGFYAVFVTPGNGIVVQYRDVSGLISTQITAFAGAPPAYVEVARSGNTFTAYSSGDGVTWTPVLGTSVMLNWSGTLLAGLVVSSHNDTALSTATFTAVNISNSAPPPPTACPTNWNCADIGNPLMVGDQSLNNGNWTLDGGGGDIWGDYDEFHYVWQTLPGDGTVSAQVLSQSNTDAWAKAGVMLRQDTTGGSAFYSVLVTPGNGIVVQYRSAQDAQAGQVANVTGVAPTYLKIGRSGTTFTAYTSADGVNWTAIAGSSVTVNMTGTLLAGLAVTSHDNFALSKVVFNSVTIAAVSNACPTSWSCADIGYTAPAGGQSESNGSWTVEGAGSDIWLAADQFHYVWQTLPGDGGVSAQVLTQGNTSAWAKAGVMLRQDATEGAAFYAVF
ncbi:MAG TPA: PQQ-binding-like beta-propeller repeat protein, partial [Ktedonobacteraceae bacterium]|nr:PQQ-binding-like beta-propeller repeat protein [Ktedonobacteraceae bacterium]